MDETRAKPSSEDGQPNSPGQDPPRAGEDRLAGDPPAPSRARVVAPDDADRWGELPVHARELFRMQGASDLPPQYRDWIDAYYARLMKLR